MINHREIAEEALKEALRAYVEHDDDDPDSLADWVDGDTVVRGPLPYPWGAA